MPEPEPFIIASEPAAGIRWLQLNRPERLNALGADLVSALRAELAATPRDCRVIIISGVGRAFCSGADLKGGGTAPEAEGLSQLGVIYKSQEHIAQLMLDIHERPQPVIAAVNGIAVGGGMALALAADIRIGAPDASFGCVFIKIGLSSCDVGTSYFLPRLVGPGRASELMLTGRTVQLDEAERIGLVQFTSAPGKLMEDALALAQQIAANSEYGVWMTKSGMHANAHAPSLRVAMELENRTQALAWYTGNMEEAMKAFVEKRPPTWKPL